MITVSARLGRDALALAHAVADRLAAAELHLFAVAAGAQGVVVLDLDDEAGVGEAHAVAGGRAEHLGVGARGRSSPSELALDQAAEAVDLALAGESRPARPCAAAPARSAPRCPRRCSGACRAPRRGRSAAPRWSRRSDSASRPGSAGRRCSAPPAVAVRAARVEHVLAAAGDELRRESSVGGPLMRSAGAP